MKKWSLEDVWSGSGKQTLDSHPRHLMMVMMIIGGSDDISSETVCMSKSNLGFTSSAFGVGRTGWELRVVHCSDWLWPGTHSDQQFVTKDQVINQKWRNVPDIWDEQRTWNYTLTCGRAKQRSNPCRKWQPSLVGLKVRVQVQWWKVMQVVKGQQCQKEIKRKKGR